MEKAYLVLQNGKIFEGERVGRSADIVGELVFTTGMVGYLETLTDPSYYGQMVVMTFPLIGNYGVIREDFESKMPKLSAMIMRECCDEPSNFRCTGKFSDLLAEQNVVGLTGIDTRALTRIIRDNGVMNAAIVQHLPADTADLFKKIEQYKIVDALDAVSTKDETVFPAQGEKKYTVALMDYGDKLSIVKNLQKRGCEVHNMPFDSSVADVLAIKPDGVMLSNGPGDPSEFKPQIATIAQFVEQGLPIFGICLGHQMLALSQGATTAKLKYGHRGANQPVKDVNGGRIYVTSQNHGYAVDKAPANAEVSFYNVNDKTCEGLNYKNKPIFSVQFHPEASSGPLDTSWLFDRFVALMKEGK